MATPLSEKDFSTLDSVFQYVPQGHDKAIKQAFYNTAATIFSVVICCTAIAVYHILEVFLKPLLWAVLCGTFLHPFKHTLTFYVTIWLQRLQDTQTPLLIGTTLLPLSLLDNLAENLSRIILRNVKTIIGCTIGLLVLYILFQIVPIIYILQCIQSIVFLAYDALGYFHWFWVWTIVVAYAICVLFFWNKENCSHFKKLAMPVWTLVLFHIISHTGPFRGPLLLALLALMLLGFISEMIDTQRKTPDSQDSWFSSLFKLPEEPTENVAVRENKTVPVNEDTKERPNTLSLKGEQPNETTNQSYIPKKRKLSDQCFIVLFWAIAFVQVWKRLWLLNLLPILIVYALLKKLGYTVGSNETIKEKAKELWKRVTEDERLDILMPRPLCGLAKLVLKGDIKIIAALENSMDKFMSILTVLLMLIGMVVLSIFMAAQMHSESMHLVSITSNVVNSSLHPELSQWLPDNETMQTTIDSMVGNAYIYGREYIAAKVHTLMDGRDDGKQLELQLLDVYDQVYRKFVARNTSQETEPTDTKPALIRQFSLEQIDVTNMTSLWNMVSRYSEGFDLDIWAFVQENIGFFMSILESVWLVLRSNLTLLINIIAAMISLVFGGGTAILNFIISAIIFITTLFYLLAASGDTYLPVQWFSSFSPTTGGASGAKFGTAVEEAISSVFRASLKMAAFYGLYTYFTHTLFGIQIVYIPAAVASVFAAIPFVGTYWACLPAVVELWLVHGEGALAAVFFALHFLPAYVVDTAIYSDIKGGHPYLTGLAIAGGMYWLGLEGAIIGPIVLVCLIVAVNVYSSMLKSETPTVELTQNVASWIKRIKKNRHIKRND